MTLGCWGGRGLYEWKGQGYMGEEADWTDEQDPLDTAKKSKPAGYATRFS